jgi:hypothetical protein
MPNYQYTPGTGAYGKSTGDGTNGDPFIPYHQVADGADATQGVTTGAKVITDADGTLQQYLRGLVHLSVAGLTTVRNTIVASDSAGIAWQSTGGSYTLTCTSVTNNNGRQGAKGDLGETRSRYYMASVTFSVGSAATAGNEIEVYWAASPSATAGTSNPGGTSGTDATFNTTPDEYKMQLQMIGSLVLSNNAGTGVQRQNLGPFIPRFRYGMPVVVNKSGQTLGSTAADHTVTLYPWSEQA